MNLINKHIALVDVSAVGYAGMYSITNKPGIPGLFHEGQPTGIIFDFLMRMRNLQYSLKPDLFVFTCDSRESLRSDLFPDYKVKRNKNKKSDPELKEMLSITKPQILRLQYKLLPYLGFNNILCTKGLEADDIQAKIILDNPSTMITVVSRDKDLRQTLKEMSRMYDPVSRKLYTHNDLMDDLNCTPDEWQQAQAIAGCTTDEVPGIPGVAIKKALQFIKGEMNPKTKTYEKIANGWEEPDTGVWIDAKEVIDLTTKLVTLPFAGTPSYKLKPNNFDNKKLRRMAQQFQFDSIDMTYQEWRFN